MNKKKKFAAKTLGVGAERIRFDENRLKEIGEAITRQDIRDLVKSKAIYVKETRGIKKKQGRSRKRWHGSIRKKVGKRKEDYIILTRKLRVYIKELKKQGKLDKEQYSDIRKKIRASFYKSKSHLKSLLK